MPRNNSGNRGGNRSRRFSNNNPEGRNQYNGGWMDLARERPATAAAAAAGAVAAGVFLWSKRSQISDQLGQISEQLGEWSNKMSSERELEMAGGATELSGSTGGGSTGAFGGTAAGRVGSTARSARASASKGHGSAGGSGTMSGGSLDTGPSGRGRG